VSEGWQGLRCIELARETVQYLGDTRSARRFVNQPAHAIAVQRKALRHVAADPAAYRGCKALRSPHAVDEREIDPCVAEDFFARVLSEEIVARYGEHAGASRHQIGLQLRGIRIDADRTLCRLRKGQGGARSTPISK
jgi:hypothetical protein